MQLESLLRFVFFTKVRKISSQLWVDPNLIGRTSDPDPLVRWVAANFIARKRIASAKQLIDLLSHKVPEVAQAARQALVRLSRGTDFGPERTDSAANKKQAIQRWREWLAMQEPVSAGGSQRPTTKPSSHDLLDPPKRIIKKNRE